MSSPASDPREPSPWVRRLRTAAPPERVAEAESARIEADTARRAAELEAQEALAAQKRAEAVRVAAETTAARLARERDEALARVAELEQQLDEPGETREPVAPPPEDVEFAAVRRGGAVVVVLALADLAAAATAIWLAYQDRLGTAPGIVAIAVTVLLAASLRFSDRPESSVAVRQGTVVVTTADGTERVDLTDERTLVEVVGEPGSPRRRVVLLRRGKPTVTVDRAVVDVDDFVAAVRRWRPEL